MVWCCCCARKKSPSKEESCCCSCWCCCWCMAAVWWYWQRLLLLVPLRDDRLEGKRRILRATGAETSPFTLERFNINDCGRKLHDHNNFLDNVLESKKRLATDVAITGADDAGTPTTIIACHRTVYIRHQSTSPRDVGGCQVSVRWQRKRGRGYRLSQEELT